MASVAREVMSPRMRPTRSLRDLEAGGRVVPVFGPRRVVGSAVPGEAGVSLRRW